MTLVLAIDVGTHATRAAIVESATGQVRLTETNALQLRRIDKVRVEQDPGEIVSATRAAVQRVIVRAATAGMLPGIAALATQRSTVVAWDRHSGDALSPALSWQDTRAYQQVSSLQSHHAEIKRRSGLVLSPHFGASKLHWLLSHAETRWQPDNVCLGPLASYLLFHLLEGSPCVCDEGNASRTQLWNVSERVWDRRLCDFFDVPLELLPTVLPIQANYGDIQIQTNDGTKVQFTLPLMAVCGDQNAAFYTFSCAPLDKIASDGWALVNAGTGAFVLSPFAGDVQTAGALLVGPYRSKKHDGNSNEKKDVDFLIEGTVNGAGSALDWCYKNGCDDDNFTLNDFYRALPGWLHNETAPPLFINTIGGLGSPWWHSQLSAHFLANEGTPVTSLTLPQQATAVLESIVFLLTINIRVIEGLQSGLEHLVATGGVAQLDAFCQKLADLTGLPVLRPAEVEATLMGAAALTTPVATPATTPVTTPRNLQYYRFQPQDNQLLHQRFQLFNDRLNQLLFMQQPILVGHRGYPAAYPENTLAGFRAALEVGARAIECDVQFSREGQPVIIHDHTLQRTTGRKGRVADFSVTELGAMSAHEPERLGVSAASEPIPTLTDLVHLLKDFPQATVFVEIKEESFADFSRAYCLEQVLVAVKSLGTRAVIISFDAEVLMLAREQGTAIGWVIKHYNTAAQIQAATLSPDFLICNYRKLPAAPAGLWRGNWHWFLYDIVDWPLAKAFAERGVAYIETWDIGAMLADKACG